MKFTKLTKKNMTKLATGKSINECGISYRKGAKGGTFSLDLMKDGVRIRTGLGNDWEGYTLEMAVEALQRAKITPLTKELRFSDLVDIYWADQEKNGKDLIAKSYALNRHIRPFFSKFLVKEVDYQLIQSYIRYRKKSGVKPATINRELALMSHIYNQTRLLGYVFEKPVFKLLKLENARTRYLSHDEMVRLLAVAKQDSSPLIYIFIRLGLLTSMRRSEILNIELGDIDWKSRTIHLRKAKAGARHQPIPEDLLKEIRTYIENNSLTTYLFPNNSRLGRIACVKSAFSRCRAKAGLGRDVTIHTLRHTAITHLVQAGVDFVTIKKISGHKTTKMLERYAHHADRLVDQALSQLSHKIPTNLPQICGDDIGDAQ
jgi:integrase